MVIVGDQKKVRAITICSDASDIKKSLSYDHTFAAFPQDTINIFMPWESFDFTFQSVSDFGIGLFRKIVFKKFNALKHGLLQGKSEGLWWWDCEVRLWDGCLWYFFKEHTRDTSFFGHFSFLFFARFLLL